MDLVEIRKKAKKLQKDKAGDISDEHGKDSAMDDADKKTAATPVTVDEIDPGSKGHGASEPDEAVSLPEKTAPEDSIEDITVTAFEEEPLDFLTLAMNALYQQGLVENKEAGPDSGMGDENLEYLCFMLSDEEYALDIRHLREIITMTNVTEIPRMPPFVLGIISLRGKIIPLFDLRIRLGLEAGQYGSKTRILVVSNNRVNMGLVVDRVTEVVTLRKNAIEPPPSLINVVNDDLLEGVGRYHDRLLIIPALSEVFNIDV